MAVVRLNRDEVGKGELPGVCMFCGEPSDVERRRQFSWNPSWVYLLLLLGLLPFLIVALIMTKRMVVFAPLCSLHRSHWSKRDLLVYGSLIFVVVAGIALVALSSVNEPNQAQDPLAGLACIGGVVLLVAWVILAVVSQLTAIRAVEITKQNITLKGVAQAFVDAVKGEDGEAWERRRPPSRDNDDDDFSEPRPRRGV